MRFIATHLLAIYLGAGLYASALMGQVTPALNILGHIYIAAVWPKIVYCAPAARDCTFLPDSIAPYIFSFTGNRPLDTNS